MRLATTFMTSLTLSAATSLVLATPLVAASSSVPISSAPSIEGVGVQGTLLPAPPIISFCFGDGSGTMCPCHNLPFPQNGGPGRGCKNSKLGSTGALLTAVNSVGGPNPSVSVTANDLGLKCEGMVSGTNSWFLQGSATVNGGLGGLSINYDGLECIGGTSIRLGRITTMGGTNTLNGVAGVAGLASTAQTLYYQCRYRNQVPFCLPPPATVNTSNALQISWTP